MVSYRYRCDSSFLLIHSQTICNKEINFDIDMVVKHRNIVKFNSPNDVLWNKI
jgi:hypothetical protein